MDQSREKRLLEKAVLKGVLASSALEAAYRSQREAAERGEQRRLVDILEDAGAVKREQIAALDDRSLEGRTLGGFDVVEKIGEGGMGSVFRARQRSLGRTVALKVLSPELAARAEVAERFRREARAAARLDHPHVVQPIDFGEAEGLIFFAMELMEGGSASEALDERGPFPERHALEATLGIARALAYARTLGIVHRDVKPDNILYSKHGTPKLADLGLVFERSLPGVTEAGLAMGTPHYMSPEQALGQRDLDSRSDIYSLGVTLYELLSGRRPFDGPPQVVLSSHVTSSVPDVRIAAPHVGEATAKLVLRMTAKRRQDRFQTPDELVDAVKLVLKGLGPGSAEVAVKLPPELRDHVLGTAAAGAAPPPPRRNRAALAFAAAALLAALAAAGALAWRPTGPPPVDLAAEAKAAASLRALLLERRAADGGYSYGVEVKSDPWTTSQALAALVLEPSSVPPDLMRSLVRKIHETELGAGLTLPEPRGWPISPQAGDDAACVEASAWVAIGLALAGDRYGETAAADADHARRFLLAAQLPDGSFASIPAAGPKAARTSATSLAMTGLMALGAARGSSPELDGAVGRAAAWLGRSYDRERRTWFPNPTRLWNNRRRVEGLGEHVAWALTEAELFLGAKGAPLPAEAAGALESYAAAGAEERLPADLLGTGEGEDYLFDLPPGTRATMTAVRWVYGSWRALAAERLAARPPPAQAKAWDAEARRVRAAARAFGKTLAEAHTFQVCESLFALELLGDARAEGSLFRLLQAR